MSKWYLCDQCATMQQEMMPYRLSQLVDGDDPDDEDVYAVETYHFCDTPCLDMFVMAIPRDPVDAEPDA